jgi:hypothetical protein
MEELRERDEAWLPHGDPLWRDQRPESGCSGVDWRFAHWNRLANADVPAGWVGFGWAPASGYGTGVSCGRGASVVKAFSNTWSARPVVENRGERTFVAIGIATYVT